MSSSSGSNSAFSRLWKVDKRHYSYHNGGKITMNDNIYENKSIAISIGGDNNIIYFIDLINGQVIRSLNDTTTTAFAMSHNGKYLITCSRNRMLQLWNIKEGNDIVSHGGGDLNTRSSSSSSNNKKSSYVRQWRGHDLPVVDIAFDYSDTLIATASTDRSVRIWHTQGHCTHNFSGHDSIVLRVYFHPDILNPKILACCESGSLRLWSLNSRRSVKLKGHFSAVTCAAFHDSGRFLVTGGRDSVICSWNLDAYLKQETISPILIRTTPVFQPVESILLLPPKCHIPSSSCNNNNNNIQQQVSKTSSSKKKKKSSRVTDTSLIVIAGGHSSLFGCYNVIDGECICSSILDEEYEQKHDDENNNNEKKKEIKLDIEEDIETSSEESSYWNAVLHIFLIKMNSSSSSSKEDYEICAITGDRNFHFVSLSSLIRKRLMVGSTDEVIDIKWFPDNIHTAIATNSEYVRLWNMTTLNAQPLAFHHSGTIVLSLAISKDGKYMISGSKNGIIRIWYINSSINDDTNTVTFHSCFVAECRGHTEAVGAVAICSNINSKTNSYFISGSNDKSIKQWNFYNFIKHVNNHFNNKEEEETTTTTTTTTNRKRRRVDGSIAMSVMYPTSERSVHAHDKDINHISISPDDQIIASCSQDKTVKLWSSSDLSYITTLRGHRRGVWALAFSPIDQVIASSAADGTVRFWSLSDFSCLKTLTAHTSSSVLQLSFLNNGAQLLTTGGDGLLKLWSIRTGSDECIASFEEHGDKVWAMALSNDGKQIVTGGADATLCVWSDHTAESVEEEAKKEEERLLLEQELSNSLKSKQYLKAVKLAFRLKQPSKLLKIFQEITFQEEENDNVTSHSTISSNSFIEVISTLPKIYLPLCLEYIREWNTNSRHCTIAQKLLSTIIHIYPLHILSTLPNIRELVKGIDAYSQRHFQRLDSLLQSSFFLEYTCSCMESLPPITNEEKDNNETVKNMIN